MDRDQTNNNDYKTVSDEELSTQHRKASSMDSLKEAENDSGYSSSDDLTPDGTTSDQESSDDSNSDPSSFNVYEGCDDDDDESDESVSSKINYIRQKQELLQRVSAVLSEEELYEAATAMQMSKRTVEDEDDKKDSVWNEAKSVLRVISQKAGELRINEPLCSTATATTTTSRKRAAPSPMDPIINLSLVVNVPSVVYESEHWESTTQPARDVPSSAIPDTVFGEGQWMAKALIWSEPTRISGKSSEDCRWRVVSDPVTCSLGLLPPNSMSLKNAVDLEEAISVTDQARLVTQSTPPFCVVHVNRAFLLLAGLDARESLIGRPVESMVQITQPIVAGAAAQLLGGKDKRFLDSIISVKNARTNKQTACRIRVVPVLDNSRRIRLSRDRRGSCMSHVLVQVKPPLFEHRSILAFEETTGGKGAEAASRAPGAGEVVGAIG